MYFKTHKFVFDLKCVDKVRQLFWKRELNSMQNSGIGTRSSVLSPVHESTSLPRVFRQKPGNEVVHEWAFNGLRRQMTETKCNDFLHF